MRSMRPVVCPAGHEMASVSSLIYICDCPGVYLNHPSGLILHLDRVAEHLASELRSAREDARDLRTRLLALEGDPQLESQGAAP